MTSSFLLNLAKMSVSGTPGTGSPSLGSALPTFFSFAEAGAVDGKPYKWLIRDGADVELVVGNYNSSGPTISRTTVLMSKIAGTAGTTKLTLTSAAIITCVASVEDFDVSQFTAKTVPIDADYIWVYDSVSGNKVKTSWANFKAVLPSGGQPIPTSSTDFQVGAVVLATVVSGSVSNGSTVAGSNLRLFVAISNTTSHVVELRDSTLGSTLSGTWKNISGRTLELNSGQGDVGYWVRTA